MPRFSLLDLFAAAFHRCIADAGGAPVEEAPQRRRGTQAQAPSQPEREGGYAALASHLVLLGGALVREHRKDDKIAQLSAGLQDALDRVRELELLNDGWKHISEQLRVSVSERSSKAVQTDGLDSGPPRPRQLPPPPQPSPDVAHLQRDLEATRAALLAAEAGLDDVLKEKADAGDELHNLRAENKRSAEKLREAERKLEAAEAEMQVVLRRPSRPCPVVSHASCQTEDGNALPDFGADDAMSNDSVNDMAVQLLAAAHEEPPESDVSLVFTDVQSSTFLWNHSCRGMRAAITEHNRLMRLSLRGCRGYEVKTEGDAFMVAFGSAADALCFCCDIQLRLLSADWPEAVLGCDGDTDTVADPDGTLCFRGLRVRMGIHSAVPGSTSDFIADPFCDKDPNTGRTDYFGPMVNFAARVGGQGRGGEIVISRSTYAQLEGLLAEDNGAGLVEGGVQVNPLGICYLKGFEQTEDCRLYQVFPQSLAGRAALLKDKKAQTSTIQPQPASGSARPPPTGDVALVFTDVQGSTLLWNRTQQGMREGLGLHNAALRALIADCSGYEVKTEGDAFMVAFDSVADAAKWCLSSQLALLAIEWPSELLQQEDAAAAPLEGDGTGWLWRGLRVRMGFHCGWPLCETDPTTGRMDYLGPVVNYGARVSGVGFGGEVVASAEAMQRLEDSLDTLLPGGVVKKALPGQSLKGFDTAVTLTSLLPAALAGRFADFEKAKRKSAPEPKTDAPELSQEQQERLKKLEAKLRQMEAEAPRGEVALVSCVSAHRNFLWSKVPGTMAQSCHLVAALYRALLERHGGYCIRTDGDFISVAFGNPRTALAFCADVQRESLALDYPQELLRLAGDSDEVRSDTGTVLWRGLRMRVSLHCGRPDCEPNPITLRMDYKGAASQVSRAIGSRAKGGEILCTVESLALCGGSDGERLLSRPLAGRLAVEDQEHDLVVVFPKELEKRMAAQLEGDRGEGEGDMQLAMRSSSARRQAPTGDVAVVVLDVERAGELWSADAAVMNSATSTYTVLLSQMCDKYGCYEARAEGEARVLVFQLVKEALSFCMMLHTALLDADWPDLSGGPAGCKVLPGGGGWLWRGLRVRMGVSCGAVLAEADEDTGATTYAGPVVEAAVEAFGYCVGGEAVVTDLVARRVSARVAKEVGIQLSPLAVPQGRAVLHAALPVQLLARSGHCSAERPTAPVVPPRTILAQQPTAKQKRALLRLQQIEAAQPPGFSLPAPTGDMVLVCVGADAPHDAWHRNESSARNERERVAAALTTARECLRNAEGYLCADFSDGFFCAFQTCDEALSFINTLLEADHAQRLRLAMHTGRPICEHDPSTGRPDFFGPPVAQVGGLCGEARRGECLVAKAVWQGAQANRSALSPRQPSRETICSTPRADGVLTPRSVPISSPRRGSQLAISTRQVSEVAGWSGTPPPLVSLTASGRRPTTAPSDPQRWRHLGNRARARKIPSSAVERGLVIVCVAVEGPSVATSPTTAPAGPKRKESRRASGPRSKRRSVEDPLVVLHAVSAALSALRHGLLADEAGGGVEARVEGRCILAAFPSAQGALRWASTAIRDLARAVWPPGSAPMRLGARFGIAAGDTTAVPLGPRRVDFLGPAVVQAIRLCGIAHVNEILFAPAVRDMLPVGGSLQDLQLLPSMQAAAAGGAVSARRRSIAGEPVGDLRPRVGPQRPKARDPTIVCFDCEQVSRGGRRRASVARRSRAGHHTSRLRAFTIAEELAASLERECMACYDEQGAFGGGDSAGAFQLVAAAAQEPWRIAAAGGRRRGRRRSSAPAPVREKLQHQVEQRGLAAACAAAVERQADAAARLWLRCIARSTEPQQSPAELSALHERMHGFLAIVQSYALRHGQPPADLDSESYKRHLRQLLEHIGHSAEGEPARAAQEAQQRLVPAWGSYTPNQVLSSCAAVMVQTLVALQGLHRKAAGAGHSPVAAPVPRPPRPTVAFGSSAAEPAAPAGQRAVRLSLGESHRGSVGTAANAFMGMMLNKRKSAGVTSPGSVSPAPGPLRPSGGETLRSRVAALRPGLRAQSLGAEVVSGGGDDADVPVSPTRRVSVAPGRSARATSAGGPRLVNLVAQLTQGKAGPLRGDDGAGSPQAGQRGVRTARPSPMRGSQVGWAESHEGTVSPRSLAAPAPPEA
eukprot:TRINITY_DN13609_c0_g3_i1.p1 TRINITY_DN13609_c0_g3~~TRINITY_DN13609_c0_g3_i1.p1  ORF type:complete len:2436 (+),score=558.29 TRINITY_DN13609_c0_g3_i1:847-7308(+)